MIQLDPMNILFSYFTSQCIFHGKPIQVLTYLRFMEFMDSENHGRHDKRTKYRFKNFKIAYGTYKINGSLFAHFICILSHPHSSIHFNSKRQNTTIFMY